MFIIMFFMSLVFAQPDASEQHVQIYVDLTEVHDPAGKKGTSAPLNILVSDVSQNTGMLQHTLQHDLCWMLLCCILYYDQQFS